MIQQCIDLALGRAFVPDSQDTLVPLARRFARKALIAVTLYKDSMEFVPVTFAGGNPVFGAPQARTPAGEEADAEALRAFAEKHKAKDCLINLATGYTAMLSSRTRRPETDEEAILLMRDNPERLLGEAPAHGCRPSIVFHPTHNFAVVFSHKEGDIAAAVGLAQRAGLGLARLQCGMSSLLGNLVGSHWSEVGKEAEILIVDRSSVFYLTAGEGVFGRPLFDVGLKEAALKEAVAERVGKLKPGGKVILVNATGLDVAEMIRARAMGDTVATPFQDQAQPFALVCCSDRPRLGYDLVPGERTVRPFAPARMRVVPLVLWGAVASSIVVLGYNGFRQTRDRAAATRLAGQSAMLESARTRAQAKMQEIADRGRMASDICDWLLISPTTETLIVQINREIEAATDEAVKEGKSIAQLDSLSIAREEGQPQMRLSLVLIGDAPAANRVFQRISALFTRLGYSTVDLRETVAPQGYRYEHLLNLPAY